MQQTKNKSNINTVDNGPVSQAELLDHMRMLGDRARAAATILGEADSLTKGRALRKAATELHRNSKSLLEANEEDVARAHKLQLPAPMIDRLMLDEAQIEAMANSLEAIAALPDPVGEVLAEWSQPSGLHIKRVRTPIGVIGVIYESRPNVTSDAGALCLKSGNACLLRGGSDSFNSARIIHRAMVAGLTDAGLPEASIQMVGVRDRDAVGIMLGQMSDQIDVIVPRGGRSLVERVQSEARVPIFAHLDGVCHIYIDASADIEKALSVTLNAKMRRVGICGAAECLLIDKSLKNASAQYIIRELLEAGCQVRADAKIQEIDPRIEQAGNDDWGKEFLAPIIAARMVEGVDGAISHIRQYGSKHTDAIIAEDDIMADKFFASLDSAILMRNVSTQFADGGEFGMGAEIGIATGKMHARGPVGIEQLTTYQYRVSGDGIIRK